MKKLLVILTACLLALSLLAACGETVTPEPQETASEADPAPVPEKAETAPAQEDTAEEPVDETPAVEKPAAGETEAQTDADTPEPVTDSEPVAKPEPSTEPEPAAEPEPTDDQTSASTGSQPPTEGPAAATLEDVQALVGQDVANLYAIAGQPQDSHYEYSCSGPGDDGILYYQDYIVFTYVEDGVETIVDAEAA